ncbi:hypothetical protein CYR55_02485 [Chimaeribacter californicus]|uniref:Uncharacterized protein n=1 Tax=Chimaeribacter californicus TaxID=2060067 RepID=A0A2N5EGN9_9GAMM|nr:hypothetical protein [Chimaeribacter californicus]PLR41712.1 hypothetical protein CYR55_02485 [Chimaeribacter californicus]
MKQVNFITYPADVMPLMNRREWDDIEITDVLINGGFTMNENNRDNPQARPETTGQAGEAGTLAAGAAPDLQDAAPRPAALRLLSSHFLYLYAFCVTLLTFLFLFMACFSPSVNIVQRENMINTVTGFLLGVALSAIIQYFFGSSLSSRIKEEAQGALQNRGAGK